jgi:hypothetical protein
MEACLMPLPGYLLLALRQQIVLIRGQLLFCPVKKRRDAMSDEIKKFIERIGQQLSEIGSLDNTLYRRIIYVSLYDAISKSGYPQVKSHHQRVIQFIDTCSGWQDRDRVSSQQLLLELQGNGRVSGRLYEFVQSRVIQWVETAVITAKDDPLFDEVVLLANPAEVVLVKRMRYKDLFYTYRNKLVHEFCQPGFGMDFWDDFSEPYYHSMMDNNMQRLPWQLVFPVAFFHRLCQDSLAGLEAHLSKNNINPFQSFEVGSKW